MNVLANPWPTRPLKILWRCGLVLVMPGVSPPLSLWLGQSKNELLRRGPSSLARMRRASWRGA